MSWRNHNLRPKQPWLGWAAIVVPGVVVSATWPLTTGLPFANRVAVGAAAALGVFAVIYLASKGKSG